MLFAVSFAPHPAALTIGSVLHGETSPAGLSCLVCWYHDFLPCLHCLTALQSQNMSVVCNNNAIYTFGSIALTFISLRRNAALVILNGSILGVHRQPLRFAAAFRRLRRCNRVGEFVSVYIQQECCHIASDGGRSGSLPSAPPHCNLYLGDSKRMLQMQLLHSTASYNKLVLYLHCC